jgi:hypothetical protein
VCTEDETVALMCQAGLADARKTGEHAFWLGLSRATWPLDRPRKCATPAWNLNGRI